MATAKKKPTAAQLAARKLFAERARAGTLGGKKKAKPASKRATNPATRKTVKQKKADMLQRANSVSGAKQVTIYIVEYSKNGKNWSYLKSHFTPVAAKETAEYMADEKRDSYWRVRSEVVK